MLSYGHIGLWEHMSVDSDGEWIREGITNKTLVIAHDGYYMSTESTTLCSAGVVVLCTATKQWLKASLAERSLCASNYRGELLGALMALLILQAASSQLPPATNTVVLHCDNRGVNSHGNSRLRSLPEKQRQADLIRHIKHISQTMQVQVKWEWVEGHTVERKGRHRSTVHERLNDQADKLVKAALLFAISGENAYEGDYPFEMVSIKLTGQRVSGSPRQALQEHWGYNAAKELFGEKNIIRPEHFYLVWWDAVGAAMSSYPKMYRVWITKHISEFCGTNVQQYYWSKGERSPKCDICGDQDEYTTHICRCRDPGRLQMFQISVQEVFDWMSKTIRRSDIALAISTYLLGRGLVKLVGCIDNGDAPLLALARSTDLLGWDCFIEGRISRDWIPAVSPILAISCPRLLVGSWGKTFITKLLNIIHKQWIYRNTLIHYRGKDGFTIPEHHEIINRVEEYFTIDPDSILPRHRHLLDTVFEALGSGPPSDHLLWLADVDTALTLSGLANSGALSRQAQDYFATPSFARRSSYGSQD